MTLLAARAIENQAYVIGVNRVGSAGRLEYSGDTRTIDPMGEMVEATPDVETTICAEVSAAVVARARRDFPFIADR